MVKTNEIKRSYYLNLFSGNADITTDIGEQFSATGQNQTFITGTTVTSGGDGYTEAPLVKVPELNYIGSDGLQSNLASITSVLTPTPINSNINGGYTIVNRGSGYATNDVLVLDNAAAGSTGGAGGDADIKVVVSNGLITGYTAFSGGTGYVNAPAISATGGGTGFTAVSFLTPTTVSATFTITSGGTGYNTGDILNFDNTGTGGSGVSATVVCNGSGTITSINLINAGSGYTKKAPLITSITSINNKAGTGFNITCALVGTSVANITILTSGTGYSTSPTIVFTPTGAGSGAAATPTIKNGCITGLTFTTLGSYTLKAPSITSIVTTAGTGASIILSLMPSSVFELTIPNGGTGIANEFISAPPPNMSLVFTPTNGLGYGAAATVITRTTRNRTFKWNIRDLQLGRVAEIGLVQLVHTGLTGTTHNNTAYAIRCLETYADGFDSYNHTSALIYMGMGFNTPVVPTYHKLISQNLNTITLLCTQDLSSSKGIYTGINSSIQFSAVFEVIDYIDEMNTY
jgi:hypothetical protein